ncbi:hypothetical protein AcW2_004110 [Taiwanofungus camphoratus]|nr:hypothetical protein AcW2_004110 [Antrodia cinnamomea]
MDAIYLLACYFSRSPRFTELEAHFLKRALQGIADGLQCSDRVVNVLQASSLLAVYFFCHGRVLEGYYHSSIAARLAMDLGLHQVRSDDWFPLQISLSGSSRDGGSPPKASFPLSAPSDAIEYAERIAAFCQIFVVDRAWSVTTGLPAALQDGDHPRAQIETIWPVPMVEMPMDTGVSNMSSSLDDGFPRCSFSSSTLTLRAKAVMLFERTSRFSASSSYDREHWSEQRSLEMSLAQLSANIPHINRPNHFLLSDDDIDLVGIHTLIYAATIHLNRDFIETQPSSYEKCLISANSVTALVRNLSDNDYDFLDPINSACWRSVADVYIRILATPYMQALDTTMDIIEQQLNVLIAAMRRLSSVFPVAGTFHILLDAIT